MGRYYIDYGTGVGDLEIEGKLEEAEALAEKHVAYTQVSVTIRDMDMYMNEEEGNDAVAWLNWYTGPLPTPEELEGEDQTYTVIDFGDFGFYMGWMHPY